MSSKPFPLLKLPYFAFIEAFRGFNTLELINLSLCSKRVRNLSKNHIKKSCRLEVFVDGSFQIWIKFQSKKYHWIIYADELIRNPRCIPFSGLVRMTKWKEFGIKEMEVIFPMKNYAIRKWLDCFMKLFDVPLQKFTFHDFVNRFDALEVKNFLNGLSVHNVIIGYFVGESHIQTILESVKITKKLQIQENKFALINTKNISFNMDEVKIERSYFIKLDCVLTMNCRIINLGCSRLKSQELNLILKNWKNGSHPELELLEAENDTKVSWDKTSILDGLDGQKRNERGNFSIKPSEKQNEGSRKISYSHYVEVRRDDGTRASVMIQTEFEHPLFRFFVWSRQ